MLDVCSLSGALPDSEVVLNLLRKLSWKKTARLVHWGLLVFSAPTI